MAGRLDAESNDIAAQITDYNSTECEQTALARPDWRGQQNLHASYSFVLPEGSDFEDETRVGQGPTRSPRGDHADFSDRGRDALFFFFQKHKFQIVFVARPGYHGVHGTQSPLLGRCGPNPPIQSFNSHPIVPPAWTRGYPPLRAIAAFNTCL